MEDSGSTKIAAVTPPTSEEKFEKLDETVESGTGLKHASANQITSKEKVMDASDDSTTDPPKAGRDPGVEEGSTKSESGQPDKPRGRTVRNQSDIFALKPEPTTLATSIFSINGSPSRKIFRKIETSETGNAPSGGSNKFSSSTDDDVPPADAKQPAQKRITRENYNDEKRPSSSYRNPLTGTGLSSNDEYKGKGAKRKDGNPLLGSGYESELAGATSSDRVPPGGYSHRLW